MRADPATHRSARLAGSALVECLVALAVAAAVFLPALAAIRAAMRADARAAVRAEGAAASRPAARAAAARLRLGLAEPDGGGRGREDALPPLRAESL